MTTYTISFTVIGSDLDPILSTIVDRVQDLAIGVVSKITTSKWQGETLTTGSRTNGVGYRRKYAKAKRGLHTVGVVAEAALLVPTLPRTFTITEFNDKLAANNIIVGNKYSLLGSLVKRGTIKKLRPGSYRH